MSFLLRFPLNSSSGTRDISNTCAIESESVCLGFIEKSKLAECKCTHQGDKSFKTVARNELPYTDELKVWYNRKFSVRTLRMVMLNLRKEPRVVKGSG